ncbi:MAG: PAS domain S-box protein [Coriobacteriia bacterium]|nr:PAS domain S-box protein [Coriobacteriia bacterium]
MLLRSLFESATLAMLVVDPPNNAILEVNDAAIALYGWTREQFVAMNLSDIDLGAEPGAWSSPGDDHAGGLDETRRRHRRADGSVRHVDVRSGRSDYQGRDLLLMIVVDVTERTEREALLATEAFTLRTMVEQSRDGIVVLNASGGVHEANAMFARMLRYSPDEVRRLSVWDWEYQYSPEETAEMIRTVDEQGDHFESKHRRSDGTTFDVEISTNAVPVGGEKLIFCICRDITERTRAEDELQSSHALLANLTAQVPGVVYQYRLYPDGSSAFPYSSPGMNDIYEYTPDEVREDATPVFGRLHPEDIDRVSADIFESARTLAPYHSEFRVVLPRQGLRWRLCDAIPHRMDDGGTTWYGVISDITARKVAEQELAVLNAELEQRVRERTEELHGAYEELVQANERLDAANRIKSTFLTNMSHELRTPLNSIIGFSTLLEQELAGPLTGEQRKQIGMINQSGRHLLSLVDEILDLSKIESGQTTLQLTEFGLAEIFAEVAGVLEPLAAEKGLRLDVVDACGSHVRMTSDYVKLKHVLLNLGGNAVKFTSAGRVRLSAMRSGDDRLSLAVTDTGPGIRSEHLEGIFVPFVQVGSADVPRPPGTGLGLTISREFATLLGGELSVASKVGSGTEFVLDLPIAYPGPPQPAQ